MGSWRCGNIRLWSSWRVLWAARIERTHKEMESECDLFELKGRDAKDEEGNGSAKRVKAAADTEDHKKAKTYERKAAKVSK